MYDPPVTIALRNPVRLLAIPGTIAHNYIEQMKQDSFKDFVMDQLKSMPELRAKAMFGGHGLYQGEQFFGILMDGRLYFKTDDQTRAAYLARGMKPFIYEKARRTSTMNYFEVPPEVLENREEIRAWATRAIQAAGAGKPEM
jgi:DNA transformation protein and related proteins